MNIRKKILCLSTALLIAVCSIAGCGRTNDSITTTEVDERFLVIDDTNSGLDYNQIIVDKDTGVMYLFRGAGYKGGLTVMLDANGTPLIYDGEY